MELKSVRDVLYKHDGEFSILFEKVLEINEGFVTLLSIKESKTKDELHKTMMHIMKQITPSMTAEEEQGINKLTDTLVNLVFKDVKECHKKIYG